MSGGATGIVLRTMGLVGAESGVEQMMCKLFRKCKKCLSQRLQAANVVHACPAFSTPHCGKATLSLKLNGRLMVEMIFTEKEWRIERKALTESAGSHWAQ